MVINKKQIHDKICIIVWKNCLGFFLKGECSEKQLSMIKK